MNQSDDKKTEVIDTAQDEVVPSNQAGHVLINASSSVLSAITIRDPEGTGTYAIRVREGNVYIILDMFFENFGCPEFEIDPTQYVLVVGGIQHNPLIEVDRPYYVPTTGVDRRPAINLTHVVQPTGVTILDRMTLRDTGKTSGSLVYEVPSGAELDYVVEYIGSGGCEVVINAE